MDYTRFEKNLRDLIESRGLTNKALAADLNLTQATITRYLHGKREPELRNVVLLAEYFNVSVDWLLGISGEKFDVLPKNIQDFAHLYSLASPDDRRVIEAVLSKYRGRA